MRRAGHTLALPADLTRQALPFEPLAPLPGASRVLLGLMPAAGRAVPVLNLERVLGFEAAATNDAALVLLIELDHELLGLPVDEVIGFVTDEHQTYSANALLSEEKILGGYVGGGHKGRFLNTHQLYSEVGSRLTAL